MPDAMRNKQGCYSNEISNSLHARLN